MDYAQMIGPDARVYLIYLTADGTGTRKFYGRDEDIPNQIDMTYYAQDGTILGYGHPYFITNFFTRQFTTVYPGIGGEAYKQIDPITRKDLIDAQPHDLYVDQYGDIQYKSSFANMTNPSVPADGVSECQVAGLPGGTKAEITGMGEAPAQVVIVDDGTFELASPIKGSVRVRLSHSGYIAREYNVVFV